MGETDSRHHSFAAVAIIGIVVLGVITVIADKREIGKIFGHADFVTLLFAFLFAALSYGAISFGFSVAGKAFGISLPMQTLLSVGFVSTVLNHLFSLGGAAGYSLRILRFRQYGISFQQTLAASLFHSYFNNLALFSLFPLGLLYLSKTHFLSFRSDILLWILVGIFGVVLSIISLSFFIRSLRVFLYRIFTHLFPRIRRNGKILSFLHNFDSVVNQGIQYFYAKPFSLLLLLSTVFIDWFASMATLWFCFSALGYSLRPGVLIPGFVVGVTLGLLSLIPGGFGIQEGSMVAAYVLLGIPLEVAFLASVLFRVVYYFIPFGLSIFFYFDMVRNALRKI